MGQINRYSDAVIASLIALIIALLIIPMPSAIIDALLVFNIIVAVVTLLTTMYNKEPLEFSIFPTYLLVSTLFRLGLYISTTRAILSLGNAGSVVDAFGSIIIGDNYVVGIIIFLILVIVQFIVITSGTSRISEVAARFTLDAMPGKQMAIDADLNSGILTEVEAKDRRRVVQREADFYGAMDGASKFVKGDATAGIIIAIVNLVGGFIIGATQQGMSLIDSMQTFGRIAIGAGLAIQIPALLLSTASGVVVTRMSSDSDLGQDLSRQLLSQPRGLMLAGILIIAFGFAPGLPKLPFLLLGGLATAAAYYLNRAEKNKPALDESAVAESESPAADNLIEMLQIDPMELEIGYSLVPLVDPDQGGDILDRITLMRRQVAIDLGYIVPPIRIRDNIQLPSHEYRVKIKGVDIARGTIYLDQLIAIDSGTTSGKVEGIDAIEPAFGLPARWIYPERREEAEVLGYTVVDPTSAVITHVSEIVKKYAHELIGRQDVQSMLDNVKQNYPIVVDELVPGVLAVGEVQQVLQNLLGERVSIRDMVTILEALGDHARMTKNIDILTENVRAALGRNICRQHQSEDGKLDVVTIDPLIEKEISEAVEYTDQGISIALDPDIMQKIVIELSNVLEKAFSTGRAPAVLASANTRRALRKIIERKLPNLAVLSYNEIAPEFELQSVGMVSLR
ncbi:MAG: flagellar biosynthesis protein FlhA [Candidatus Aquicultor primus]|uniref:Flagellar biosynthesis protein FlhA n=1 Tax=Candidatus Aquicultor primus TaxID=1797195 RepID=A0A1F2UX49_9ACTN|nr:MAG: flagellar biosynthesis protein FlhA [Candidatus Aquicultor primus]HCH00246.1 flagellar biosynthesis protein FlhA [Actinomycetota bacterium]